MSKSTLSLLELTTLHDNLRVLREHLNIRVLYLQGREPAAVLEDIKPLISSILKALPPEDTTPSHSQTLRNTYADTQKVLRNPTSVGALRAHIVALADAASALITSVGLDIIDGRYRLS